MKHNDKKFDYVDSIAKRKHIIVDKVRYIGKESNNLDEVSITGLDGNSYLEYENLNDFRKWVLALKPKDVKDRGISKMELKRKKADIRKGKRSNFRTKINSILLQVYKSGTTAKTD